MSLTLHFFLHKDEVEDALSCHDVHCHACGFCLQPGDKCITASDFSKNDEARSRCHLGSILFESDCFTVTNFLLNDDGEANLGVTNFLLKDDGEGNLVLLLFR